METEGRAGEGVSRSTAVTTAPSPPHPYERKGSATWEGGVRVISSGHQFRALSLRTHS